MNENQRADLPLGDDPGRDHRFTEGGRGGEDPVFMAQYESSHLFLFGTEFPAKMNVNRGGPISLIVDRHGCAAVFKETAHLFQASPGQADMLRQILRAANYPGHIKDRQTHGLGPVKLGILKGRQLL